MLYCLTTRNEKNCNYKNYNVSASTIHKVFKKFLNDGVLLQQLFGFLLPKCELRKVNQRSLCPFVNCSVNLFLYVKNNNNNYIFILIFSYNIFDDSS